MRSRIDRRHALLLAVLLLAWAVVNDLALDPPDLGGTDDRPPVTTEVNPGRDRGPAARAPGAGRPDGPAAG